MGPNRHLSRVFLRSEKKWGLCGAYVSYREELCFAIYFLIKLTQLTRMIAAHLVVNGSWGFLEVIWHCDKWGGGGIRYQK